MAGTFFIPPEFFGGVGLAQGLGQAAQGMQQYIETGRKRKREDVNSAIQELQVLASLGVMPDNPLFAQVASRALGGMEVAPELTAQQILERANRQNLGGMAPEELTTVSNIGMGLSPLGVPAMVEEAELGLEGKRQDVEFGGLRNRAQELGIQESELRLEEIQNTKAAIDALTQNGAFRDLFPEGVTPTGGLLTFMGAAEGIRSGRIRDDLTREQIKNAQLDRQYTRFRMDAERKAAATKGVDRHTMEYAMMVSKSTGVSPLLVYQGVTDPSKLSPEQQAMAASAVGTFMQRTEAETSAAIRTAAAKGDPNATLLEMDKAAGGTMLDQETRANLQANIINRQFPGAASVEATKKWFGLGTTQFSVQMDRSAVGGGPNAPDSAPTRPATGGAMLTAELAPQAAEVLTRNFGEQASAQLEQAVRENRISAADAELIRPLLQNRGGTSPATQRAASPAPRESGLDRLNARKRTQHEAAIKQSENIISQIQEQISSLSPERARRARARIAREREKIAERKNFIAQIDRLRNQ